MNVYTINVRIYATAYILADSETAALAMARHLPASELIVPDQDGGDIAVSGAILDSPDMPPISLSPNMTIDGVEETTLELVEQIDAGMS